MNTGANATEELVNREYKYGFVTEIETDTVPRGLKKDIVRLVSAKENEPSLMVDWRLRVATADRWGHASNQSIIERDER